MRRRFFTMFLAVVAGSGTLPADFSYEQTTQVTGGAMAQMMAMAARFSKQAAGPQRSTVMLKGTRMATFSTDTAQIIDLASETFTDINFARKEYSVITFQQMTAAMAKLRQQMSGARSSRGSREGQPAVELKPSVSVKEGGQSKQVSGVDTRLMILTLEMEATDPQSGNQGTMMMSSDMWMATSVPGYDELRGFQEQMGKKIAVNLGGALGMMASNPQMGQGFGELYKEISKLTGVPVQTVARMGMKGMTMPPPADAPPAEQTAPPPQERTEQQAEAPGGLSGAIGGRLGRLGGLGRRRKEEPKKEETGQATATAPPAPASGSPPPAAGASGSLMETTTTMSNFSSASVDAARMEIPAGFKKVEHPMERR